MSIGAACAIGIVGAVAFEPWLALLVPVGLFLVVAYNLELLGGRFHSDLWFGLAWGGFPVVCGYAAVAGDLSVAALLAAAFAVFSRLPSARCRTMCATCADASHRWTERSSSQTARVNGSMPRA